MEGLITKSTGSWYSVLNQDNVIYQGRLRGKLRLTDTKTTNPICVGDRVVFEIENEDKKTITIEQILPRTNYIIRKSTHKTGQSHLLAANIDQALLICTIKSPRTPLGFIDRFLVSAECFRIPVTLVFNKIDLLNTKQREKLEESISMYQKVGYNSIETSVKQHYGIETFQEILKNKLTLLAGNSGVGKSSLINIIAPSVELKTGEVSKNTGKGKHTTTFSEIHSIDSSSHVIDSPGIRELGFFDINKTELSHHMKEMQKYIGKCKFNNCTHTHEPECAVLEAFGEGEILERRYQSYLYMLDELAD